jgi:exodeoxyribonuclease VII large subunit
MKVFSVTELNLAIKSLLETNFRGIALKGEISNFKRQSSGHLYFSLKDADSQVSAVLFRGSAAALPRLPKEGDQVVVQGEIGLYTPRGQYQIIVRQLQFAGQGELLMQLEKRKQMLAAKGWFAPERKKPIPKFPRKIGVITSPTGAVIRDILNVLSRRFSNCHVILNPVKVQGAGAADEIAQAVIEMNRYSLVDVIILGRGGGSIEDLWSFNEEVVAKAIFESTIPIISAVGHETDVTISDFVADLRAPTPSAAAEIVTQEKANLLQHLSRMQMTTQQRMLHTLQNLRQHLTAVERHPIFSSPYTLLSSRIQMLDALKEKLILLSPKARLDRFREQFERLDKSTSQAMATFLIEKKEKLRQLCSHLSSLNPKNVLKKGYSIVKTDQGSVIRSSQEIQEEQQIHILMQGGSVKATATGVINDDK